MAVQLPINRNPFGSFAKLAPEKWEVEFLCGARSTVWREQRSLMGHPEFSRALAPRMVDPVFAFVFLIKVRVRK